MTINIRGVHLELTDAIRQYVEEKMASIEKFGEITLVDVEVGKTTEHHQKGDIFVCRANVEMPGDMVRVERESEDLYKAIDKVRDHLRETLAQRKDRKIDERKG
jgi:putative sigma-54 modulation protein